MCSHHLLIDKIRTFVRELQASQSNRDPGSNACGCTASPKTNEALRAIEQVQDHRDVCSSIDGCDTTR